MSHFLAERRIFESVTSRQYAAVQVELVKGKPPSLRVVVGSICLVKAGVYMKALPQSIRVVDEDGEEVNPSGQFYVSAESIDPHHLLIDALNGNRPF